MIIHFGRSAFWKTRNYFQKILKSHSLAPPTKPSKKQKNTCHGHGHFMCDAPWKGGDPGPNTQSAPPRGRRCGAPFQKRNRRAGSWGTAAGGCGWRPASWGHTMGGALPPLQRPPPVGRWRSAPPPPSVGKQFFCPALFAPRACGGGGAGVPGKSVNAQEGGGQRIGDRAKKLFTDEGRFLFF